MTEVSCVNSAPELNKYLRLLWKLSAFLYIVCSTAFSSQSYLMMLNSYALYFFLGVSALCILIKGTVKFNLYTLSLMAFFLVTMVGCLYSVSEKTYTSLVLHNMFVVVCITFCFVNYIDSEKDIRFLFKAFIVGGLVLDIYIVTLYGSSFIDQIMNETRVGGLAGNENSVGLKSCYAACIALYFVLNDKISKITKLLYMLVFAVCVFFAFITASKKVFILLIFGSFFLFFFRENKKKGMAIKIKNTIAVIGAIGIILYLVQNAPYFSVLRSRMDEFFDLLLHGVGNSTDSKRKFYIEEGLRVFSENPFFGDGTGASYQLFGTYSHCNFVELLMNNGLLGFVVFYSAYPMIFYSCFSMNKRRNVMSSMTVLCSFLFISVIILSIGLIYITDVYFQILLTVAATYVLQYKNPVENDL